MFATSSCSAPGTTPTPVFATSDVWGPRSVAIGESLPVAPAANSSTRSLFPSALPLTNKSPAGSNVRCVAEPSVTADSVVIGATLPLAPAANSLTIPSEFSTQRCPAWSRAMPRGWNRPVASPPIVAMGATLPLAPGAYSVIVSAVAFETYRRPAPSTATANGDRRPVVDPAIVRAGLTFPVAFAA